MQRANVETPLNSMLWTGLDQVVFNRPTVLWV